MKAICVDDDKSALRRLLTMCDAIPILTDISGFESSREALEWAKQSRVDLALLDIQMPEMDGITLATRLREYDPDIKIIFVTGHECYAVDAFRLHADGYMIKPVEQQRLEREIEYVLSDLHRENQSHIVVNTFGDFEVIVDGSPISFSRSKSRELLAYLIDRKGASCTTEEIAAALWEDYTNEKNTKAQLRILISDLRHTLANIGQEDIVVRSRGQIAVMADQVDCDYYRMLQGDMDAVNAYRGEYMSQYSWAELTAGQLAWESGRY